MDSIWVVPEFLDVFHVDFLGMLPDRDINFAADMELGTKTISIPLIRCPR